MRWRGLGARLRRGLFAFLGASLLVTSSACENNNKAKPLSDSIPPGQQFHQSPPASDILVQFTELARAGQLDALVVAFQEIYRTGGLKELVDALSLIANAQRVDDLSRILKSLIDNQTIFQFTPISTDLLKVLATDRNPAEPGVQSSYDMVAVLFESGAIQDFLPSLRNLLAPEYRSDDPRFSDPRVEVVGILLELNEKLGSQGIQNLLDQLNLGIVPYSRVLPPDQAFLDRSVNGVFALFSASGNTTVLSTGELTSSTSTFTLNNTPLFPVLPGACTPDPPEDPLNFPSAVPLDDYRLSFRVRFVTGLNQGLSFNVAAINSRAMLTLCPNAYQPGSVDPLDLGPALLNDTNFRFQILAPAGIRATDVLIDQLDGSDPYPPDLFDYAVDSAAVGGAVYSFHDPASQISRNFMEADITKGDLVHFTSGVNSGLDFAIVQPANPDLKIKPRFQPEEFANYRAFDTANGTNLIDRKRAQTVDVQLPVSAYAGDLLYIAPQSTTGRFPRGNDLESSSGFYVADSGDTTLAFRFAELNIVRDALPVLERVLSGKLTPQSRTILDLFLLTDLMPGNRFYGDDFVSPIELMALTSVRTDQSRDGVFNGLDNLDRNGDGSCLSVKDIVETINVPANLRIETARTVDYLFDFLSGPSHCRLDFQDLNNDGTVSEDENFDVNGDGIFDIKDFSFAVLKNPAHAARAIHFDKDGDGIPDCSLFSEPLDCALFDTNQDGVLDSADLLPAVVDRNGRVNLVNGFSITDRFPDGAPDGIIDYRDILNTVSITPDDFYQPRNANPFTLNDNLPRLLEATLDGIELAYSAGFGTSLQRGAVALAEGLRNPLKLFIEKEDASGNLIQESISNVVIQDIGAALLTQDLVSGEYVLGPGLKALYALLTDGPIGYQSFRGSYEERFAAEIERQYVLSNGSFVSESFRKIKVNDGSTVLQSQAPLNLLTKAFTIGVPGDPDYPYGRVYPYGMLEFFLRNGLGTIANDPTASIDSLFIRTGHNYREEGICRAPAGCRALPITQIETDGTIDLESVALSTTTGDPGRDLVPGSGLRMFGFSRSDLLLSWKAPNATTCTASDNTGVIHTAAGPNADLNVSPSPLDLATTYTVSCSGPGDPVEGSVTVEQNGGIFSIPVEVFAATPFVKTAPQISTLSWKVSSDVTSCSIDNSIGNVTVPFGSINVAPGVTTVYTITCQSVTGPVTASTTISIGNPASDTGMSTLTADPVSKANLADFQMAAPGDILVVSRTPLHYAICAQDPLSTDPDEVLGPPTASELVRKATPEYDTAGNPLYVENLDPDNCDQYAQFDLNSSPGFPVYRDNVIETESLDPTAGLRFADRRRMTELICNKASIDCFRVMQVVGQNGLYLLAEEGLDNDITPADDIEIRLQGGSLYFGTMANFLERLPRQAFQLYNFHQENGAIPTFDSLPPNFDFSNVDLSRAQANGAPEFRPSIAQQLTRALPIFDNQSEFALHSGTDLRRINPAATGPFSGRPMSDLCDPGSVPVLSCGGRFRGNPFTEVNHDGNVDELAIQVGLVPQRYQVTSVPEEEILCVKSLSKTGTALPGSIPLVGNAGPSADLNFFDPFASFDPSATVNPPTDFDVRNPKNTVCNRPPPATAVCSVFPVYTPGSPLPIVPRNYCGAAKGSADLCGASHPGAGAGCVISNVAPAVNSIVDYSVRRSENVVAQLIPQLARIRIATAQQAIEDSRDLTGPLLENAQTSETDKQAIRDSLKATEALAKTGILPVAVKLAQALVRPNGQNLDINEAVITLGRSLTRSRQLDNGEITNNRIVLQQLEPLLAALLDPDSPLVRDALEFLNAFDEVRIQSVTNPIIIPIIGTSTDPVNQYDKIGRPCDLVRDATGPDPCENRTDGISLLIDFIRAASTPVPLRTRNGSLQYDSAGNPILMRPGDFLVQGTDDFLALAVDCIVGTIPQPGIGTPIFNCSSLDEPSELTLFGDILVQAALTLGKTGTDREFNTELVPFSATLLETVGELFQNPRGQRREDPLLSTLRLFTSEQSLSAISEANNAFQALNHSDRDKFLSFIIDQFDPNTGAVAGLIDATDPLIRADSNLVFQKGISEFFQVNVDLPPVLCSAAPSLAGRVTECITKVLADVSEQDIRFLYDTLVELIDTGTADVLVGVISQMITSGALERLTPTLVLMSEENVTDEMVIFLSIILENGVLGVDRPR